MLDIDALIAAEVWSAGTNRRSPCSPTHDSCGLPATAVQGRQQRFCWRCQSRTFQLQDDFSQVAGNRFKHNSRRRPESSASSQGPSTPGGPAWLDAAGGEGPRRCCRPVPGIEGSCVPKYRRADRLVVGRCSARGLLPLRLGLYTSVRRDGLGRLDSPQTTAVHVGAGLATERATPLRLNGRSNYLKDRGRNHGKVADGTGDKLSRWGNRGASTPSSSTVPTSGL